MAISRRELFTDILNLLQPDGVDPKSIDYYVDGTAQEGEWGNIITQAFKRTEPGSPEREAFVSVLDESGFWQDTDDQQFWIDAESDNAGNLADLVGAAEERFPDLLGGPDADANAIVGDDFTPGFEGVMDGGTLQLVRNPDGQQDFYVISYEYGGDSFYYKFDSVKALEAAIGANLGGGSVPMGATIDESVLSDWTNGGDPSEIVDVPGSFNGYMDDIVRDASLKAGINDPTLVGDAMKDPEIMSIIARSAAEGNWSKAQMQGEMRDTAYYQDVIYPGIANFYGGSQNPEQQWAVYNKNISDAAKSLGLPPGDDGSWKHLTGTLLEKGVTDTAFATFVPVYQRAQGNIGFADALSKWTEKYTGTSISSFEDYYDVLAGNAPANVMEIVEIAGLQYMADNQGFEISDTQLRTIGETVDLTEQQAGIAFSNTARRLLALGARGLRRGDLTSNQILEAEAGFSSTGANIDAIKLKMDKLAREEGLVDDPTSTIFTDFNREGAPVKLGLQSTINEGA